MSMKRLFVLRHNKGGAPVLNEDKQPMYFDNKPDAKEARNKRNEQGGTAVVSYGPDHKLY
jgi:hypothetical protein